MYRLHIFSHYYPNFSLKPLSDGIVYRGTVTQVDDIRKEVEVKELGPKNYPGFPCNRIVRNRLRTKISSMKEIYFGLDYLILDWFEKRHPVLKDVELA